MSEMDCPVCGRAFHHFMPNYPSPNDLMRCVTTLRRALDEVETERDRLREFADMLDGQRLEHHSHCQFVTEGISVSTNCTCAVLAIHSAHRNIARAALDRGTP